MSGETSASARFYIVVYVFLFLVVFVAGIFLGTQWHVQPPRLLLIQQDLMVERKMTPDTFSAELTIKGKQSLSKIGELEPKEQSAIRTSLNAINKLVVEAKEICSGGSFYFAPKESYEEVIIDNKLTRKPVYGYSVSMNIACEFKESEKQIYETLLNKTLALVEQSPYLRIELPQISSIITKDQVREKTQDMRDEILSKAKEITTSYGKILGTKCGIEDIRFNGNSDRYEQIVDRLNYQRKYRASESAVGNIRPVYDENVRYKNTESTQSTQLELAAMPVIKDREMTLSASFTISCKN